MNKWMSKHVNHPGKGLAGMQKRAKGMNNVQLIGLGTEGVGGYNRKDVQSS